MTYTPTHYKENNSELIHEFIHKFSLATLISISPNQSDTPDISFIPLILTNSNTTLLGHMAKANPHWKQWNKNTKLTVIFNGPSAYISPSWYPPDPSNVPTWNYMNVVITGSPKIITESEIALQKMNQMVNYFENLNQTNWKLEIPINHIIQSDITNGIIVFEIKIDKLEAKFKLSQKQNFDARTNVINQLSKKNHFRANEIAEYMKKISSKP